MFNEVSYKFPREICNHADSKHLIYCEDDVKAAYRYAIQRIEPVIASFSNAVRIPLRRFNVRGVEISYMNEYMDTQKLMITSQQKKALSGLQTSLCRPERFSSMESMLASESSRSDQASPEPFNVQGYIIPIYQTHLESLLLESNLLLAEWSLDKTPDGMYKKLTAHLKNASSAVTDAQRDPYVRKTKNSLRELIKTNTRVRFEGKYRPLEIMGNVVFEELLDEANFNEWRSVFNYQSSFVERVMALHGISAAVGSGHRENSFLKSEILTCTNIRRHIDAIYLIKTISAVAKTAEYAEFECNMYGELLSRAVIKPEPTIVVNGPLSPQPSITKPDFSTMVRNAVNCSSEGVMYKVPYDLRGKSNEILCDALKNCVDTFAEKIAGSNIPPTLLTEATLKLTEFDLPSRFSRLQYDPASDKNIHKAVSKLESTLNMWYSALQEGRVPSNRELKRHFE